MLVAVVAGIDIAIVIQIPQFNFAMLDAKDQLLCNQLKLSLLALYLQLRLHKPYFFEPDLNGIRVLGKPTAKKAHLLFGMS